MNRQTATEKIEKAIDRVTKHIDGHREVCLPTYLEPQIERFLETLRQMKASMQNPTELCAIDKYMGHAIADGWPYESVLGKLICEAEDAYHSEIINETWRGDVDKSP